MTASPTEPSPGREALHAAFLSVLPRIELHGRVSFRHVRCPSKRDDCVAEMVALCWLWFLRLAGRGRDATAFPSALATFAARAVRSGRRLAGQERAGDVMNPLAQARHGFAVEKLPDRETPSRNPLADALADNTRTPPPEAAVFRLDWPRWVATRTERDRGILHDFMLGETTTAVSRKYGLSAGRCSQLRREFKEGWEAFCAG
jgi:hypothetical protein